MILHQEEVQKFRILKLRLMNRLSRHRLLNFQSLSVVKQLEDNKNTIMILSSKLDRSRLQLTNQKLSRKRNLILQLNPA